jgi:hypothetical protein
LDEFNVNSPEITAENIKLKIQWRRFLCLERLIDLSRLNPNSRSMNCYGSSWNWISEGLESRVIDESRYLAVQECIS